MKLTGKYFRKSGVYDANDGWCRKWTYKVSYSVSNKNLFLVALTDGMMSRRKNHLEVEEWIENNDMVQMSKSEMVDFMLLDNCNFKADKL